MAARFPSPLSSPTTSSSGIGENCDLPSAVIDDDPEQSAPSPKDVEQYPVIRRRSRSVGSRPLIPPTQTVKNFIGGFRTYNPPVQKHEALKVTKPFEPVHLSVSNKRTIQQGVPNPSDYKFHAKPAPKFKHSLVDRRQAIPGTVPHTPKFSEAGKASLQSWRARRRSMSNRTLKQVMKEERKKHEFHAKPCPNFTNPSIPVRGTLRERARGAWARAEKDLSKLKREQELIQK